MSGVVKTEKNVQEDFEEVEHKEGYHERHSLALSTCLLK